jgi:hypothetical protein
MPGLRFPAGKGKLKSMADSQTIQALLEACSQAGCPICRVTHDMVERQISNTFYESILDPISRRMLRSSFGLCREHAWLALDAKLSDALGFAIVYEDLLRTVLETVPGEGELRSDAKKVILGALKASKPCPACEQEKTTQERALSVMNEKLLDGSFLQKLQKSDGLCLPHLMMAIGQLSNRHKIQVLMDLQRMKMEILRAELAEFIRKNDYRFAGEGFGPERDSWKRAVKMGKK